MATALRKMGNSAGIIISKAVLQELGISVGMSMDVRVEDGRLVATPLPTGPRDGWAEDAAKIGPVTQEEAEWMAFGNQGDAELEW